MHHHVSMVFLMAGIVFFSVTCLAQLYEQKQNDYFLFNQRHERVKKDTIEENNSKAIDFSGCTEDPKTGLCCVEKEANVKSVEKKPILKCTHKNVEKCHYTYVTKFEPIQAEVCEEMFQKTCQITFKKQAFNETVQKCYKPLTKECNGRGEEVCQTVYESSCTTKYIEKKSGKFVGDTTCNKLPVEICGAGCVTKEGDEECHEKIITSVLDVPEETCDLNPQKICKFETQLTPFLKPVHECTKVPMETCHVSFSTPKEVEKPLMTKWCLDPEPAIPGETYDESNALSEPLSDSSSNQQVPKTSLVSGSFRKSTESKLPQPSLSTLNEQTKPRQKTSNKEKNNYRLSTLSPMTKRPTQSSPSKSKISSNRNAASGVVKGRPTQPQMEKSFQQGNTPFSRQPSRSSPLPVPSNKTPGNVLPYMPPALSIRTNQAQLSRPTMNPKFPFAPSQNYKSQRFNSPQQQPVGGVSMYSRNRIQMFTEQPLATYGG